MLSHIGRPFLAQRGHKLGEQVQSVIAGGYFVGHCSGDNGYCAGCVRNLCAVVDASAAARNHLVRLQLRCVYVVADFAAGLHLHQVVTERAAGVLGGNDVFEADTFECWVRVPFETVEVCGFAGEREPTVVKNVECVHICVVFDCFTVQRYDAQTTCACKKLLFLDLARFFGIFRRRDADNFLKAFVKMARIVKAIIYGGVYQPYTGGNLLLSVADTYLDEKLMWRDAYFRFKLSD